MDPKENREEFVRDAKRNLILDAARDVFAEKGFHEARLEDVAARAGFSKASLYNYYEDKETLYLYLGIREHGRLAANLEEAVDFEAPFEQNLRSLLQILFAGLRDQFAFISSASNPQSGLFCNHAAGNEARTALVIEFLACARRMMDLFERVVAAGKKRGDIKSKLENSVLSQYAASLLRGVVFEWKISGRVGNTEKDTENIMEFVRHGFALK